MDSYKNIARLKDTINIPVIDNGEPLAVLDPAIFKIDIRKKDMENLIGPRIFLRRSVLEKLILANTELQKAYPESQLLVTYGYRSPEVQQKYFNEKLDIINATSPDFSEEEKVELAHSMSAHPDSAGHTCAAAVDLSIWNNAIAKEWDMGSAIAEFGDIAYTFYPELSKDQKSNRLLLQTLLVQAGFAPFLGEWWHFSYGDKEWAFYYKQPNAIYGIIPLAAVAS